MSALRHAMSHAVLGWVKPELDETLRKARAEIEAHVEAPAEAGHMGACAAYLHQVQGTLRMVELYAPAMVAEEMEQLAQALQQGSVGNVEDAAATLMRGTMLLPDYLERLQDGHRDIPIVLLPLLNEIRAARGAAGLSESALLAVGPADDGPAPSEEEIEHARGSLSGRNRALLDSVGGALKEELLRTKDALDLHLRTGGDIGELKPQLDALSSVADTLGMMGLGMARNVVQQQRATLAGMIDGTAPADDGALLDIAGALLYVDAMLDEQVDHLGAPAEADDGAGAVEMRRTLDVLSQEAIANFARAREDFVAFIETGWDHSRLAEVPALLGEVVGALRMLDLPQAADYLEGVRRYIGAELIERRRVPGGHQLDTLADAMASLEYYLEALRDRRPNRDEILDIARASLETLHYWPLPVASTSVGDASVDEDAAASPAQSDAGLLSVQDAAAIPDVAAAEGTAHSPAAADASSSFGETDIDALQFDADAFDPATAFDAVAAEPVTQPLPDTMLATLPQTRSEQPPADAAHAAGLPALADDQAALPGVAAEPDEPVYPMAPAAQSPAVTVADGGFDEEVDGIDSDIRDVFLEEFDEEMVNLERLLPVWKAAPDNMESLRPVRRVFHTLKGSGRLVGAKTLGEFSWKIESMLNRVLDGSRPASPAVVAMVDQAVAVLPQINAALRGQAPIRADLGRLEAVAERIAAGEDVYVQAEPPAAAETIPEVSMPAEPVDVAAPASVDVPLAEVDAEAMSEPVVAEGTPASVDSVLLEILEAEVGGHLQTLRGWLTQAEVDPQPADEPLLRALHTINGAFAMTDVPEITEVTGRAETYVQRLLAAGQLPSGEGVSALADVAAAISTCLEALRGTAPRIPAFATLATRLQPLVDALPAAQWPPVMELHDLDEDEDAGEVAATASASETVDSNPVVTTEALGDADDIARFVDGLPASAHAPDAADVAHGDMPGSETAAPIEQAPHRDLPLKAADWSWSATYAPVAARHSDDALPGQLPEDVAAQAETTSQDVPSGLESSDQAVAAEGAQLTPAAEVPVDEHSALDAAVAAGSALDSFLAEAVPSVAAQDEVVEVAEPSASTVAEEVPEPVGESSPDGALEHAGVDATDAAPSVVFDGGPVDVPVPAEAEVAEVVALIAPPVAEAVPELAADIGPDSSLPLAQPANAVSATGDAGDSAATSPEIEEEPADMVASVDAVASADEVPLPTAMHDAPEPEPEPAPEDMRVSGEVARAPFADAIAPVDAHASSVPEQLDPEPEIEPEQSRQVTVEAEHDAVAPTREGEAFAWSEAASVVPEPVHADDVAATGTASVDDLADAAPATFAGHETRSTQPARQDEDALDESGLDMELVEIFVEEGRDLLDHCDGLLAALREAPEDHEIFAGLQRDLHTLKGGARMAGINAIGDLGHAIESLLEAVASGRTAFSVGDVRLLERGFDHLHYLLTRVAARRALLPPDQLVQMFDDRAAGLPVVDAEAGADVAAAVGEALPAMPEADAEGAVAAPDVASAATRFAATPLSAPLTADALAEPEVAPRASQEQVRVRADLLDQLVNHAGEVAIYRSRLEQQMGAFRNAMAELDRTNARLRDQLRRLDLETEAQIVARYQREQDNADRTFDPLELDRFSTLQQLSRALNESAADLGGLQGVLDDLSRQYDGLLQQQSRVSTELQDGLMSARMVPFDGVVPRLRRAVRQAADETGKHVELQLDGTHGELDRSVLDHMVAPIEHMLRNSVAHGIEAPAARVAAGKPEEGTIRLRMRREGSEIVLQVSDDGRGLDRAAIRRRAEERGLVAPGQVLTDAELDGLIMQTGFSTAETVSQLAGRGVGMDVVRNEVLQLGGSVEIASVDGQGVTFTLRLPQTLAVTQAVFVQIGETTYSVPVASVSGIGRIARERYEAGSGSYHYNGEDYALHDLGALVGHGAARAEGQAQVPLLLVRAGDLRAAVAIDQVLGNREIVVKSVGPQIASVPGIYGATITGEGEVVVILDVAPLVRRHLAQPERPQVVPQAVETRHVPLVMVVDDSLTMRKVTGRVLERNNFEVVTARDGVEALERLEERVPDLMLLDIEMPRMDGYELATAMRADPRYKEVPIVMITSRTGDKHRQRAMDIGVQRYLGKPYQELDLMRNVYDLLGIARVRQ